MIHFNPTITKQTRKRCLKSGELVHQQRYFVNYRCPDTGTRKLPSFTTKRLAESFRADLMTKVSDGSFIDPSRIPTIREAVDHWLEQLSLEVKPSTLRSYRRIAKLITGPLLEGTAKERCDFDLTGIKPHMTIRLLKLLGDMPTTDLTTANIRKWHNLLAHQVGRYSANRSLSTLKSVLALTEEDFGVRSPAMPTNLAKRKLKLRKQLLPPELVAKLLHHARADHERGVYYAFPFLAGTRVSEQLGLLWEDVDFEGNLISIRRIQERDGSLTERTKTEAGTRDIPMMPLLREMLLSWRLLCPRMDGELVRASHQYPTTVTLSGERRKSLIRKAVEKDIVIIEDDYEFETNYMKEPTPALKSLDRDGNVIYVGSLSKSLFPGLRIGFLVGPREVIEEARALRRLMMRHPPCNNQRTTALFLSLGYHDALLLKLHRSYRERWREMGLALEAHLPNSARVPSFGGSSYWVRGPEKLNTIKLAQEALKEGIIIEPGQIFFNTQSPPENYFRLGFSSIERVQIEPGIKKLAILIDRQLET